MRGRRELRGAPLLGVLVLLGSLVMGCTEDKPTAIVLRIDSDLSVPQTIDRFNLEVTREGGVRFSRTYALTPDAPDAVTLPATLTLVASDPAQTALVTLTGVKGQATVLSQQAVVSFIEGKTLLLALELTAACLSKPCSNADTCRAGRCESVVIDPAVLPEYRKEDLGIKQDAGPAPPDAMTDSRVRDALPPPDGGDLFTPDVDQPDLGPTVPGIFVPIPAGTFYMGTYPDSKCAQSDEVRHEVTLTHDFEIQATEVTQEQFEEVMGYNPSHFQGDLQRPVENMSWHDAAYYCNKLSYRANTDACYHCTPSGGSVICSGLAPYMGSDFYSCPGYRLPTEAEWEYAYRAGSTSAFYDGSEFSHDVCYECFEHASLENLAWYCINSDEHTQPVGQKTPNAWGLFDMAGNVFELCNDWYVYDLGTASVTDPNITGDQPKWKVWRGGCYDSAPEALRTSYRLSNAPDVKDYHCGFRPVRTVIP